MKLLALKFDACKKYSINLSKTLFFGEVILISLEAYFELLISGYMNYLFKLHSKNGELIAVYSSYYCILMALIILPLMMVYVLTRPMAVIQQNWFENRWGSLFEGYKRETKWQLAANLVFIMRRFLFVLISFKVDYMSSIQIILINLINLGCLIYYGYVKPFDSRLRTRIDMFNEISVTVITWHMMFFTQFVPDPRNQSIVGWSMIICICFNALCNVLVVLWFAGRSLYLICTKYYNILEDKYDKCFTAKDESSDEKDSKEEEH